MARGQTGGLRPGPGASTTYSLWLLPTRPRTKDPTGGAGPWFPGPHSNPEERCRLPLTLSDEHQGALWSSGSLWVGIQVALGRVHGSPDQGHGGEALPRWPCPIRSLAANPRSWTPTPWPPALCPERHSGTSERPQLSSVLGWAPTRPAFTSPLQLALSLPRDWAPLPPAFLSQSPPLPTEACAPAKAGHPQPQTRSALKNPSSCSPGINFAISFQLPLALSIVGQSRASCVGSGGLRWGPALPGMEVTLR